MAGAFNTVDLFYNQARQSPDKVALIFRDKKLTFGDLEKSVTATAAYFLGKGIRKGDRVMVFVPMSDDLYRTVLALFRIGAVAVFLDEWVGLKRLNACCRLAACSALIGTPKGRVLAWLVPGLRQISLHLGLGYDKISAVPNFPETARDDIALITFTTGSTGTPKAAIRTHGLLDEQFRALVPLINPREGDICMPVLPIVLLINLGAGITSVIAEYKASKPGSLDPARVVAQIREYQVNTVIASPFFVKKMAGYLLAEGVRFNELKKILTGGAPVFPAEARTYTEAFPNADIRIVYGSTEAEPISSIVAGSLASQADASFRGLRVGHPERCVSMKIISITDQEIMAADIGELEKQKVALGEIGEIIVSGKHVLRAYLHNPEALKRNKIFVGETCWHRTGDSGYLDENGDLFLTGRCNSLITIQDKMLSPFVYENHLQALDSVEIGTIMLWNGRLTAVVELKGNAPREPVRQAIGLLPEAIADIVFIRKIPRDPRHNSKIDYEKLGAILGRGAER
jgi:acyl-CoA synthetase (AMP-forming)/AMP-acid ligase II